MRKGAVAATTAAAVKAFVVGVGVRRIEHGAVDTDQPQSVVKGAGRRRRRQRPSDEVENASHRFDAETLPSLAQVTSRRRFFFPLAHSPGMLVNLANREMGEEAHRQDHPKRRAMIERTRPLMIASGINKGLFHNRRRDNLSQARQSIQNVVIISERFRAASLPRHSHRHFGNLFLSKHKLPDGSGLR